MRNNTAVAVTQQMCDKVFSGEDTTLKYIPVGTSEDPVAKELGRKIDDVFRNSNAYILMFKLSEKYEEVPNTLTLEEWNKFADNALAYLMNNFDQYTQLTAVYIAIKLGLPFRNSTMPNHKKLFADAAKLFPRQMEISNYNDVKPVQSY